jgi:NADH-quinone oxidoreductase subunit L
MVDADLIFGSGVRFIALLPLAAAVLHATLIGLLRRSLSNKGAAGVSIAAASAALLVSIERFWALIGGPDDAPIVDRVVTWIGLGVGSTRFNADFALRFDALSAVMCFLVCGLAILVHLYAYGFMAADTRDDRGYQRFHCYVDLSVAAMLVLVLADNIFVLFLGWEGVALASYLMIGFWHAGAESMRAASRAFIASRVGDIGFIAGLLLLFWTLAESGAPTISFAGIEAGLPVIEKATATLPGWLGGGEVGLAGVIALCLFAGACAKSAQLPLVVWLPQATTAPSPALALMHGGTTVAAGVYVLARFSFLYAIAPDASMLIAWVGGATALFAATVACVENDIDKVLAWSTVSQLGLAFLAAGAGAHTAAIFHITTHAFVKALLFMAAGVIVLSLRGEKDMRRMGGIGSRMRATRICMWFGVVTLCGLPFTASFFAREQLLVAGRIAGTLPGGGLLDGVILATITFTAFYSVRLIYCSLYGETHVARDVRQRIGDPARSMLLPMAALCLMCAIGGLFGLPQSWGEVFAPGVEEANSVHHFLARVVTVPGAYEVVSGEAWGLTGMAILLSLLGAAPAVLFYLYRPDLPERVAASFASIHRLVLNGYYLERLYHLAIVRPFLAFSHRVLMRWLDQRVIDGAIVSGGSRLLQRLAESTLRRSQSGLVQGYYAAMVVGSLLAVVYFATGCAGG